jgi:hypothetical protein
MSGEESVFGDNSKTGRKKKTGPPRNAHLLVTIHFSESRNPGLVEVRKWFESVFLPALKDHTEDLKIVGFSAVKQFSEASGKSVATGAEARIAVLGATDEFYDDLARVLRTNKYSGPVWFGRYQVHLLQKLL